MNQSAPNSASATPWTCRAQGELQLRAQTSARRLEIDVYEPKVMYDRMAAKTEGWPGDTEGRLLLGQVLVNGSLGRESNTLEELLSLWDDYSNDQDFFGADYDKLNEQQMASHGWVLRGLSELHAYRGCDWSRERIEKVVKRLALRCLGQMASYPIDHREGMGLGMHSGTGTNVRGNWILSTDFGCIFILLDGLVQAQELLHNEQAEALCGEMVQRFLDIDIVGLGLQTHATLTALRGILRYMATRPQTHAQLLPAVIERFDQYMNCGMSETWANHNWYNDPRWTEPCAIVDSMQVGAPTLAINRRCPLS